ncbi:MAG: hypothetical protein ICCCNLDF_02467 [Planctomycetes bacterium]|nr:hypothetical protein [Planctomycetota bacterium]
MTIRRLFPYAAVLLLGVAAQFAVQAQDEVNEDASERKSPARRGSAEKSDEAKRDQPSLPALKVYEWGVATMNWDGSDEGPDDVPAFYYEPGEVPMEAQPAAPPQPEPVPEPKPPRPPVKIRKPVLYFECDRDVVFDLDVRFTSGKMTWMYPKPNRLTDASTAQWDNIQLYSDSVERDKFAPPELHAVDASHWAGYSRDGSTGSIVVNGEHERFLFYEGARNGLPEADIFINAEGQPVVHNYTAHELLDLRVHVAVGAEIYTCYVARVPAASGEQPGEVVLKDDALVAPESLLPVGRLTSETSAAGLTEAQARVFERCWQADMAKVGTMSWRRTQKALDELMELKLTLPAGIGSEVKRVGYVLVNNIDLTRQAEMEALVQKAAEGDADAESKLKAAGTAGAGALRRAMSNKDIGLKQRLKLAKLLGEMSAS